MFANLMKQAIICYRHFNSNDILFFLFLNSIRNIMDTSAIQGYLSQKVNPLMQKILVDIIKQQPRDLLNFCKVWFERQSQLRKQDINTDSQQQEQNDQFKFKLQPRKKTLKWYIPRKAICGEVYGNFNKRIDNELKFVKKKTSVNNRILFRIKSIFLFKDLDDKQVFTLINTMQEEKYSQGSVVISQGQAGTAMFIVDEGQLQCYKIDNQSEILLKKINEGDFFGELSLLYNTPRYANIRVKKSAVLFKLNRAAFNSIVRDRNLKKRKMYWNVLQKVDLFKDLEPNQKNQLEDISKEMHVHPNQYVIREGKAGNKFYIVQEGKLVALKKQTSGHESVVYEYKQGDYFGQLCLFKNRNRQASIMSLTQTKLLYFQRQAFERVIGPVEKLVQRNSILYEKYKSL